MAREDDESFFKFCSEADVRCPCQSHHVCQSSTSVCPASTGERAITRLRRCLKKLQH